MKTIIIGAGEIGRAMAEVLSPHHEVTLKDKHEAELDIEQYDMVLVCFPWSDSFIDAVQQYQNAYRPRHTVVVSTVPIGTCSKLGAIHSPVEGKHPRLAESIALFPRWLGGGCLSIAVQDYFGEAGMFVRATPKPEDTEFLKLLSTSLYGVTIQFMRYGAGVADILGTPYEYICRFNTDYNELYHSLGLQEFQRYILYRPEGPILGHCVGPNSRILHAQFPHPLVKEIHDFTPLVPGDYEI